jgi:NAD(P)H-flavin reductase
MYSAANRPGSDRIDFFIRLYPDGKASQYIKNTLMIGQAITINGPFGNFSFSDAQWRPSICVAGGTGMAPLHAVLEEAASRHDPRPIHFFFGARTQDELYCLDTIARWKKELPSFTFIPVLSDEPTDSNWTGERGMVTDVMAHHIPDVFGLEAYLCGPPGMIDAASDYLQQAGLTTADIHADRFVQTK